MPDPPLVRPAPPVPWWQRLLEPVSARLPVVAWSRSTARVVGALASVVVLVVVAVVVLPPALRSRVGGGPPPENSLPRAQPATTPSSAEPAASLLVHVAGAVADPGVHEMKPGARVVDAIDAAGGPADDADLDALDLAAKVNDGQRVYVPHDGEVPAGSVVGGDGGGGSGGGDAPVDLNNATVDDLDKLPGVGPSLAGAIVEYRRRHGPFTSVDQLLDVPGIGEAKLSNLRSKVRI